MPRPVRSCRSTRRTGPVVPQELPVPRGREKWPKGYKKKNVADLPEWEADVEMCSEEKDTSLIRPPPDSFTEEHFENFKKAMKKLNVEEILFWLTYFEYDIEKTYTHLKEVRLLNPFLPFVRRFFFNNVFLIRIDGKELRDMEKKLWETKGIWNPKSPVKYFYCAEKLEGLATPQELAQLYYDGKHRKGVRDAYLDPRINLNKINELVEVMLKAGITIEDGSEELRQQRELKKKKKMLALMDKPRDEKVEEDGKKKEKKKEKKPKDEDPAKKDDAEPKKTSEKKKSVKRGKKEPDEVEDPDEKDPEASKKKDDPAQPPGGDEPMDVEKVEENGKKKEKKIKKKDDDERRKKEQKRMRMKKKYMCKHLWCKWKKKMKKRKAKKRREAEKKLEDPEGEAGKDPEAAEKKRKKEKKLKREMKKEREKKSEKSKKKVVDGPEDAVKKNPNNDKDPKKASEKKGKKDSPEKPDDPTKKDQNASEKKAEPKKTSEKKKPEKNEKKKVAVAEKPKEPADPAKKVQNSSEKKAEPKKTSEAKKPGKRGMKGKKEPDGPEVLTSEKKEVAVEKKPKEPEDSIKKVQNASEKKEEPKKTLENKKQGKRGKRGKKEPDEPEDPVKKDQAASKKKVDPPQPPQGDEPMDVGRKNLKRKRADPEEEKKLEEEEEEPVRSMQWQRAEALRLWQEEEEKKRLLEEKKKNKGRKGKKGKAPEPEPEPEPAPEVPKKSKKRMKNPRKPAKYPVMTGPWPEPEILEGPTRKPWFMDQLVSVHRRADGTYFVTPYRPNRIRKKKMASNQKAKVVKPRVKDVKDSDAPTSSGNPSVPVAACVDKKNDAEPIKSALKTSKQNRREQAEVRRHVRFANSVKEKQSVRKPIRKKKKKPIGTITRTVRISVGVRNKRVTPSLGKKMLKFLLAKLKQKSGSLIPKTARGIQKTRVMKKVVPVTDDKEKKDSEVPVATVNDEVAPGEQPEEPMDTEDKFAPKDSTSSPPGEDNKDALKDSDASKKPTTSAPRRRLPAIIAVNGKIVVDDRRRLKPKSRVPKLSDLCKKVLTALGQPLPLEDKVVDKKTETPKPADPAKKVENQAVIRIRVKKDYSFNKSCFNKISVGRYIRETKPLMWEMWSKRVQQASLKMSMTMLEMMMMGRSLPPIKVGQKIRLSEWTSEPVSSSPKNVKAVEPELAVKSASVKAVDPESTVKSCSMKKAVKPAVKSASVKVVESKSATKPAHAKPVEPKLAVKPSSVKPVQQLEPVPKPASMPAPKPAPVKTVDSKPTPTVLPVPSKPVQPAVKPSPVESVKAEPAMKPASAVKPASVKPAQAVKSVAQLTAMPAPKPVPIPSKTFINSRPRFLIHPGYPVDPSLPPIVIPPRVPVDRPIAPSPEPIVIDADDENDDEPMFLGTKKFQPMVRMSDGTFVRKSTLVKGGTSKNPIVINDDKHGTDDDEPIFLGTKKFQPMVKKPDSTIGPRSRPSKKSTKTRKMNVIRCTRFMLRRIIADGRYKILHTIPLPPDLELRVDDQEPDVSVMVDKLMKLVPQPKSSAPNVKPKSSKATIAAKPAAPKTQLAVNANTKPTEATNKDHKLVKPNATKTTDKAEPIIIDGPAEAKESKKDDDDDLVFLGTKKFQPLVMKPDGTFAPKLPAQLVKSTPTSAGTKPSPDVKGMKRKVYEYCNLRTGEVLSTLPPNGNVVGEIKDLAAFQAKLKLINATKTAAPIVIDGPEAKESKEDDDDLVFLGTKKFQPMVMKPDGTIGRKSPAELVNRPISPLKLVRYRNIKTGEVYPTRPPNSVLVEENDTPVAKPKSTEATKTALTPTSAAKGSAADVKQPSTSSHDATGTSATKPSSDSKVPKRVVYQYRSTKTGEVYATPPPNATVVGKTNNPAVKPKLTEATKTGVGSSVTKPTTDVIVPKRVAYQYRNLKTGEVYTTPPPNSVLVGNPNDPEVKPKLTEATKTASFPTFTAKDSAVKVPKPVFRYRDIKTGKVFFTMPPNATVVGETKNPEVKPKSTEATKTTSLPTNVAKDSASDVKPTSTRSAEPMIIDNAANTPDTKAKATEATKSAEPIVIDEPAALKPKESKDDDDDDLVFLGTKKFQPMVMKPDGTIGRKSPADLVKPTTSKATCAAPIVTSGIAKSSDVKVSKPAKQIPQPAKVMSTDAKVVPSDEPMIVDNDKAQSEQTATPSVVTKEAKPAEKLISDAKPAVRSRAKEPVAPKVAAAPPRSRSSTRSAKKIDAKDTAPTVPPKRPNLSGTMAQVKQYVDRRLLKALQYRNPTLSTEGNPIMKVVRLTTETMEERLSKVIKTEDFRKHMKKMKEAESAPKQSKKKTGEVKTNSKSSSVPQIKSPKATPQEAQPSVNDEPTLPPSAPGGQPEAVTSTEPIEPMETDAPCLAETSKGSSEILKPIDEPMETDVPVVSLTEPIVEADKKSRDVQVKTPEVKKMPDEFTSVMMKQLLKQVSRHAKVLKKKEDIRRISKCFAKIARRPAGIVKRRKKHSSSCRRASRRRSKTKTSKRRTRPSAEPSGTNPPAPAGSAGPSEPVPATAEPAPDLRETEKRRKEKSKRSSKRSKRCDDGSLLKHKRNCKKHAGRKESCRKLCKKCEKRRKALKKEIRKRKKALATPITLWFRPDGSKIPEVKSIVKKATEDKPVKERSPIAPTDPVPSTDLPKLPAEDPLPIPPVPVEQSTELLKPTVEPVPSSPATPPPIETPSAVPEVETSKPETSTSPPPPSVPASEPPVEASKPAPSLLPPAVPSTETGSPATQPAVEASKPEPPTIDPVPLVVPDPEPSSSSAQTPSSSSNDTSAPTTGPIWKDGPPNKLLLEMAKKKKKGKLDRMRRILRG